MGHMPGNEQTIGVNFGIQKKITSGLLATYKRQIDHQSVIEADRWGNPSINTRDVKQKLANLYLKTLDPEKYADLDVHVGVGKMKSQTTSKPKKKPFLPEIRNPVLSINSSPFRPPAKRPTPKQVVGYAGFRPERELNVGVMTNWEYFYDHPID